MSLDWITELPPSHYHDVILVVVDRLTKQAHFIPTTKSMAALGVAALFVQHVVRVHGLPDTLVSDRDPVFIALLAEAARIMWGAGQPLFCLPPADRWADGADEFGVGAVPQDLY